MYMTYASEIAVEEVENVLVESGVEKAECVHSDPPVDYVVLRRLVGSA